MITAAEIRALGSILRMMENFTLRGNSETEAPSLRAVLNMSIPQTVDGKAAEFLLETDRALAKSDLHQASRAMDMAMKELVSEFQKQKGIQTDLQASSGSRSTN
jgi:murein L,D-transpeptidase YcbB/YkuD